MVPAIKAVMKGNSIRRLIRWGSNERLLEALERIETYSTVVCVKNDVALHATTEMGAC